ncbi:MAG TPA: tail fiber domain-containing protein, partial [Thermoanaerobaculia bacterium]|nr:tail fiber domain-containing protein [Thermoanaerobaculia bacterium]
ETLARLVDVPIQTWSYREQSAPVRHMGPMAQDFAAAYGLGTDDKSINPLDASGVALAAIQGLYEMVKERDAEIDALKGRLSKLEAKVE